MNITEIIQSAIKSKKAIIGYKESIKFIKCGKPKMVIIAKNAPEKIMNEIKYNAKIFEIPVEIFNGTSKDLGVICGKPYPITTITIEE